jgi:hypothetical protein
MGGGTAHRMFHIPNKLDGKTPVKLDPSTIERLRAVDLIIIDVIFLY